jgi:hypothetical protein
MTEQIQPEDPTAERQLEIRSEKRRHSRGPGTKRTGSVRIRRVAPVVRVQQDGDGEKEWPGRVDTADRRIDLSPEEEQEDRNDDDDQEARGCTASAEGAAPPKAEAGPDGKSKDPTARSKDATGDERQRPQWLTSRWSDVDL